MLPTWNHPPRARYSLDWTSVRSVRRSATCKECGTVFALGNRKRGKTCSRECHVQGMRRGGDANKPKPQSKCARCLYAVGFGSIRISRILGISQPHKRLARNGIKIDHKTSCRVAARLGLNTASKRVPEAIKEARKRLADDLRLLSEVIGDIRRELKAKEKNKPEAIEAARGRAREYYKKNRNRILETAAARTRQRPGLRLAKAARCRVWNLIKRTGKAKTKRTFDLIGCSHQFLMSWLQSKFTDGMTWDNYGEWEVDHIVPCASFDLSREDHQRACFHYTNMQPLWKRENRIKHDRKPSQHQPELVLALA
jgi:hypothetical protein